MINVSSKKVSILIICWPIPSWEIKLKLGYRESSYNDKENWIVLVMSAKAAMVYHVKHNLLNMHESIVNLQILLFSCGVSISWCIQIEKCDPYKLLMRVR